MAIRIDADQRKLLEWLAEPRQIDSFVGLRYVPYEVCSNGNDVRSLIRRGLIEKSGRGRDAEISISNAGLEAIGKPPRPGGEGQL